MYEHDFMKLELAVVWKPVMVQCDVKTLSAHILSTHTVYWEWTGLPVSSS